MTDYFVAAVAALAILVILPRLVEEIREQQRRARSQAALDRVLGLR